MGTPTQHYLVIYKVVELPSAITKNIGFCPKYLLICSTAVYLLDCKITEIEKNIEIAQNSLKSY